MNGISKKYLRICEGQIMALVYVKIRDMSEGRWPFKRKYWLNPDMPAITSDNITDAMEWLLYFIWDVMGEVIPLQEQEVDFFFHQSNHYLLAQFYIYNLG